MNMDDWRANRRPLLKPSERAIAPTEKPSKQKQKKEKPTWRQVWAWLKPRLEKAGRTKCEFDFLEHTCKGPLDPCHSKKRRKCEGNDIYTVAIGCRNAHDLIEGVKVYPSLGRRMNQSEMERYVLLAIKNHGGLILPTFR
jgi:hypothetical protein